MEQESFTTYIIDKIHKFYNIFKFKHEYNTSVTKFIYKLFSFIFFVAKLKAKYLLSKKISYLFLS